MRERVGVIAYIRLCEFTILELALFKVRARLSQCNSLVNSHAQTTHTSFDFLILFA